MEASKPGYFAQERQNKCGWSHLSDVYRKLLGTSKHLAMRILESARYPRIDYMLTNDLSSHYEVNDAQLGTFHHL